MTVKVLCYCDLCKADMKFDTSDNAEATEANDFNDRGVMVDIASGDVDAEDFQDDEFSNRIMIKHACDKCKAGIRDNIQGFINALRNGKKPVDIFRSDAFDLKAPVAKPKAKSGKKAKADAANRGGFDPESDV